MITVRDLDPVTDGGWLAQYLDEEWGGPVQARRGEVFDALTLPALVAERDGERAGVLSYQQHGDREWEVAVLNAVPGHTGVGTALVEGLVERAGPGCRIWLVTTNDNVDALRFYQRRGFRLRELRAGAVDEARRARKPSIPVVGHYGIPLRDELELVLDT